MTQSTSTKAALWSLLQRWGIPILIGFLGFVSLFALAYQAAAPVRESRYQITDQFKYSDDLTVQISYPKRLRLEKPSASGYPVSVWLGASQSPTRTSTYTLSMEPVIGEISFTDKEGVPSGAPRAGLNPEKPMGTPMTWYIQRVPIGRSSDTITRTVTSLGLHAWDASGQKLFAWSLPIELESPAGAWWRQFLDLTLGPATPQIGLIGILLALTWRWFEKSREEREKRRRQRESDDIASLEGNWQTDPSGGVDRYLSLRERIPTDESDLTGNLERMWESGWRERVLDQAIEAFRDGHDERARVLATHVRDYCGNAELSASIEAENLLVLLSPSDKIAVLHNTKTQLDAIIFLADSRGTILADRLVPQILELLAEDKAAVFENIKHLKELDDSSKLHPRWLLREGGVRQQLEKLDDLPNLGDDRSSVKALLLEKPYLWHTLPRHNDQLPVPYNNDEHTAALRKLDWRYNPFVPDRIELDSPARLDAYVIPPLWSNLIGHQAFVFSAEPGGGQTSALWKAAREWQKRTSANWNDPRSRALFPVFVNTRSLLASSTRSACYDALAYDIVQAVLQFFLWNRASFGATPRAQQRAVSRLISSQWQRLGNLGAYSAL